MSVLEPIHLTVLPPYYMRSRSDAHWWAVRETDLQWAFETWLREERPALRVKREVLIAPGFRPDFVAEYDVIGRTSCIVFEMKRWGHPSALRQLSGYLNVLRDRYYVVNGVLIADQWDWKGDVPDEIELQPFDWDIDFSGLPE